MDRGQPDRKALNCAIEALKLGRFVMIAPEGRESVAGGLEQPRGLRTPAHGELQRPRAHLGDPGGGFVPTDRVIGRAFAVVWRIVIPA